MITVVEPCELPLARVVDVAVTGGTVAAVAAALGAAETGARVLLVAPRLYLGEDLCESLELWRDAPPDRNNPLLVAIFQHSSVTTPLRVKRVLTEHLCRAGVEVLLGCLPVGLLENRSGGTAGLVLANRAGRQAVAAKRLIDGGRQPLLIRLARPDGTADSGSAAIDSNRQRVYRYVIGGDDPGGGGTVPVRTIPGGAKEGGSAWDVFQYELTLPLDPFSPASMAEAEQRARDQTFRHGQKRASETLRIVGDNADHAPLVEDQALIRVCSEDGGRQAGRDAARAAAMIPDHSGLRMRTFHDMNAAANRRIEVRECRKGLRPSDEPGTCVPAGPDECPVLASVDVVVVGGGTAGAAAAIAAAREGADVLVVEFQHAPGGVGTVGLIGTPYHGLDIGFARNVPFVDSEHGLEDKAEWLRRALRAAGGKVWSGSLGHGAWMEQDRVVGVAVATPYGHGLVRAGVVIDGTGNAQVASAAGATIVFGDDGDDIALQGDGLALRPLRRESVNSDFLLVDDSDVVDVSCAVLGATLAADPQDAFDIAAFVQTRERRRLAGEFVMTVLDQLLERRYPDTVAVSKSDYDAHGYPSHPFFTLLPHTPETRKANHPAPTAPAVFTPYRCLLPKGLENLLITGIGISMHRDASAMVRMQRDLLNQGYAAGLAAVMALRDKVTVRDLGISELQQRLVRDGVLPASVLAYQEPSPPTAATLDDAIATYLDGSQRYEIRSRALALLWNHPGKTRERLRRYDDLPESLTQPAARLDLAKLRGMLGDPAGIDDLIAALETAEFDARILQGGMAEFAHLPTPVDALILALGFSGDRHAVDPILRKLALLHPGIPLSHHRAVALALERLGDPRAAPPLAAKLREDGMMGHVMKQVEPLFNQPVRSRRREGALREIVMARTLYHCGDWEGLGFRILCDYRHDVRGLFAQHADRVLSGS